MSASRGFTLFELMIALALTTVVALASAQLVAESVLLFEGTGRALRNPAVTLAIAAVRRDVQLSAGLAASPEPVWSEAPLELIGWDGRRVRLSLEDGELVRTAFDAIGRQTGQKTLARGVTSLLWRAPNPWTIDVKLITLAATDPAPNRKSKVVRFVDTRRFALRGSPYGRAW